MTRNLAALASLVAVGVGFGWWIHPGCGLVVVGTIVFASLAWSHVRSDHVE